MLEIPYRVPTTRVFWRKRRSISVSLTLPVPKFVVYLTLTWGQGHVISSLQHVSWVLLSNESTPISHQMTEIWRFLCNDCDLRCHGQVHGIGLYMPKTVCRTHRALFRICKNFINWSTIGWGMQIWNFSKFRVSPRNSSKMGDTRMIFIFLDFSRLGLQIIKNQLARWPSSFSGIRRRRSTLWQ